MKIGNLLIAFIILFTACENKKGEKTDSTKPDTVSHAGHRTSSDNAMMLAMQPAMDSMMAVKLTENIDYDFAALMLPHHQAAIDMSVALLREAKDSFVTGIARQIIADQKAEIGVMNDFLNRNRNISKEKNAPANEMHHMHKMMKAMENIKPTGNIERDYIIMMIPHHEGAVNMARMEADAGKDPAMKKLAQNIIKNQEAEIAVFKKWLQP